MKRSVIAWALLAFFALGATPAWAAGTSAARDIIDWTQPAPAEDENAATDPEGSGDDGELAPTITRTSVSGQNTVVSDDAVSASGEGIDEQSSVLLETADAASGEGVEEQSSALPETETATGTTAKPSPSPAEDNTPPVAENQELETYRGVSIGGQLTAHDAECDELTFEIATDPMKGTVQLTPDGCFVYTPAENKRGKDYFGFRAVDSAGNVSQEGTVIIRLLRQKSKVTYSDMTGNGSEYAAIVLTENGVFTGEYVGTDYVFNPDAAVTRGEFLSMCMAAAEKDLLKGVSSTGFLDDGAIDTWLKPYVATALMNGYIRGEAAETGANFNPGDTITLREACVTLNSVLGVTDVVSAAAYVGADNSDASWAQAVANLTACGVMRDSWEDLEVVLTRSGAAELLANAIGLLSAK